MDDRAELFVGIDVSKDQLDVHWHPTGASARYAQTPRGRAALVARLLESAPQLTVLEATGGYERAAAEALSEAGLACAVVNARQTRDYARATGRLAKTDAIDAEVVARFAQAVRPEPRQPRSAEQQALEEAVRRRRQLVEMRVAERHRLARARAAAVRRSLERVIRTLDEEIEALEAEVAQLMARDAQSQHTAQLVSSAPGVGMGTAQMMVSWLPELGRLNRRQIASLVGLAPINRDSGQWRGRRCIGAGRAAVRAALYMPTLTATRYNPTIRAFYGRLRARGKPFKVAITACMRKLTTILNAMVITNTVWNPNSA